VGHQFADGWWGSGGGEEPWELRLYPQLERKENVLETTPADLTGNKFGVSYWNMRADITKRVLQVTQLELGSFLRGELPGGFRSPVKHGCHMVSEDPRDAVRLIRRF